MSDRAHVLTINGGSSSIKFALYDAARQPRRVFGGHIDRIGRSDATLVSDSDHADPVRAADHAEAAQRVIEWLERQTDVSSVSAIGHRVVHGGVRLVEHQRITAEVMDELRAAQPLDLAHLPLEIALIDAFASRFPGLPQVACFDTAFHRALPRVAQILPVPRRYFEAGVRRLGFHGLSYEYLMCELGRIAPQEARGRVVLAHLGNGASLAAVRDGKPVDTSMAFTPTAGLVMSARAGDLDPGLLVHLMREEKLSPEQMEEFLHHRCGMIGVSETSGDMRDLLARRAAGDERAADAVALFCYQARKWIGAFAAALGGLDTLVFSAGIGERSPDVRREICEGLAFLDLHIEPARNEQGGDEWLISRDDSRVRVRVIETNEEVVIARTVCDLLSLA